MKALVKAGRPDDALDVISRVLPENPGNPLEQSCIEPFTLTNSYEGPQGRHPGQAMFAWRTGSAGWMLKVIWDAMIGIIPRLDGVHIQPCLPTAWKQGITVVRQIRGKRYTFHLSESAKEGALEPGANLSYHSLDTSLTLNISTAACTATFV